MDHRAHQRGLRDHIQHLLSKEEISVAAFGLCAGILLLSVFTDVFASILPTLTQLVHDILHRFSSAYRNLSFTIPAEPEGYSPQSPTLLFSLLGILLTAWLTWGVGYRSGLITVAGTLPFLLLCVIINDTPPHVAPLILMLAAWLSVLLCKERHQEPAAMDAARLGITLMAVLLLLGVVGTIYPKEDTRDRELPQAGAGPDGPAAGFHTEYAQPGQQRHP